MQLVCVILKYLSGVVFLSSVETKFMEVIKIPSVLIIHFEQCLLNDSFTFEIYLCVFK